MTLLKERRYKPIQTTTLLPPTKRVVNTSKPTIIDLFAGIGGFHLAFKNVGAECVFASEWNEYARKTYIHNFQNKNPELFSNNNFIGDINSITDIKSEIPNFDILTGGFPCQPFSQAGHKKGFNDTRGTLFFNIANIIKEKQPKAFFIENVRGLLKHNGGKTFEIIKNTIEKELGYSFFHKIIRASDFGVPQHRPRLFMVGFKDRAIDFQFPEPQPLTLTMSDVFKGNCEKKIGFTLRVGGRGSHVDDRRNWEFYRVDGEVKRIGIEEGKKLQGFPSDFEFPVSDVQAMKQLGNSVAIPAIQATAREILRKLA
jgi:DNA (cytosine-5)-methyltransferase 1